MAGPGDHGPMFESGTFPDADTEAQYRSRLKRLIANLSNRDLFTPGIISLEQSYLHSVKLEEFAAFAIKCKWAIPEGLSQLASAAAIPSPPVAGMVVPQMCDLPSLIEESGMTEDQIFDWGISGDFVFMVVVPLLGACKVPPEALSHFMAGVDEYTAEGMPEHYSGQLSGKWTIKRDRLRVLDSSLNTMRESAHKLLDAVFSDAYKVPPEPGKLYSVFDVAAMIAVQDGMTKSDREGLHRTLISAASDMRLPTFDAFGVKHRNAADAANGYTKPELVNAWLKEEGSPLTWRIAGTDTEAAPPIVLAVDVMPTEPEPLPTQTIATVFDGIEFSQERWIKNIGSAKWLQPANRGKGEQGGAPATWCPLTVATAIHSRMKSATPQERREKQKALNALNSRFKINPVLSPWLDAWNDHYSMFSDADEG